MLPSSVGESSGSTRLPALEWSSAEAVLSLSLTADVCASIERRRIA